MTKLEQYRQKKEQIEAKNYPRLYKLDFKCFCGRFHRLKDEITAINDCTDKNDIIIVLSCGHVVRVGKEKRYYDEVNDKGNVGYEVGYNFCGYPNKEKAEKDKDSRKIKLKHITFICCCGSVIPIGFNKLDDYSLIRGHCYCGVSNQIVTMNEVDLMSDELYDDEDVELSPEEQALEDELFSGKNLTQKRFEEILELLNAFDKDKPEPDTSHLNENKLYLSMQHIINKDKKTSKKTKCHK